MRRSSMLLVSCLLASCLLASAAIAQTLDERELRESWIGRQRADLIAAWGEPTKTKQRKGKEVLVYKHLFSCGIVFRSSPEIPNGSAPPQVDPGADVARPKRPSDPFPDEPTMKWDKTKVVFHLDGAGRVEDLRLSLPSKREQKACMTFRDDSDAD